MPVQLAFETKALREICEREDRARRALGLNTAEELKAWLADLRAARSVADLLAIDPQRMADRVIVDLGEGKRMVFCANHTTNPTDASKQIDWARVTRIKIVEIGSDQPA